MQRHRDPVRLAEVMAPHPACNQNLTSGDGALVRHDPDNPACPDFQPLGNRALDAGDLGEVAWYLESVPLHGLASWPSVR